MMMDTTIEAAQEILKDSPNGVLLDQDELSGWFGSMDKYSGARGAQKDRAFWLQAYNGGSYTVSRVTRGNLYIQQPVGVDPGRRPARPIRKLADGGEDDGLLQRFIPIMLRPAVDGRDEAPGQSVFDYSDLINNLRDLKPPKTGHLLPATAPLKFDDGALKIREELEKKHLDLMKLEGLNRKLTSHFGKYNGIFARLCVVFHCVEHVNDEAAARRRHRGHCKARGGLPARLPDEARHGVLCRRAGPRKRPRPAGRRRRLHPGPQAGPHHQPRRPARQTGTCGSLKRHETDAVFEQLDALGWVTRTPGPRPSDPPHWIVNPAVHQKFANERSGKERRERTAR